MHFVSSNDSFLPSPPLASCLLFLCRIIFPCDVLDGKIQSVMSCICSMRGVKVDRNERNVEAISWKERGMQIFLFLSTFTLRLLQRAGGLYETSSHVCLRALLLASSAVRSFAYPFGCFHVHSLQCV